MNPLRASTFEREALKPTYLSGEKNLEYFVRVLVLAARPELGTRGRALSLSRGLSSPVTESQS